MMTISNWWLYSLCIMVELNHDENKSSPSKRQQWGMHLIVQESKPGMIRGASKTSSRYDDSISKRTVSTRKSGDFSWAKTSTSLASSLRAIVSSSEWWRGYLINKIHIYSALSSAPNTICVSICSSLCIQNKLISCLYANRTEWPMNEPWDRGMQN